MVAAVAKHEVALKGMVPLRAELGDCWESAHREARGYVRVDQSSSARRALQSPPSAGAVDACERGVRAVLA